MVVLDTNLIIRLAVMDDAQQLALVKKALANEKGWISVTVLLECGWVLKSAYGYPRETMITFLEALLASDQFELEDESAIAQALIWFRQGGDFADALHLARSQGKGKFLTFDANFCKSARADGVQVEVLTLLN